jgi:hypothetical protein
VSGPQLHPVSQLAAEPERLGLGGEVADVTILFADLGGYSTYAESRDPNEVVELLNRFALDERTRAHADWGSGPRRRRYEIDPTGLYALRWAGGRLERVPTEALRRWIELTSQPIEETVGPLVDPPGASVPLW